MLIEVAAVVGVMAGAALQSATGFGFSLVAAPLVFGAAPPAQAIGLLLAIGTEVNVLTLATERRRPRPLGRRCAALLAWAAPGAVAGVAVLRALDPVSLQVAVTLGVAGTLAARRLGPRRARLPAWAAGLAAGGLTTSTSTSGPPLLLHLLGRGLAPERARDTLTVCFLGLAALGAIALWATGTNALPDPVLALALVPLAALGHVVGRPVFARLARAGHYEPVLTAVLVAAVVAGLAGVIA